MKPSRILFVHSGSDLYGASRSLLRLSSRLAGDGITVKVVLPHEGPLLAALQNKGIVVEVHKNLPVIERHKVRNLQGLLRLSVGILVSTVKLLRLFQRFKPDVVHTMTAIIPSTGIAAKLGGITHIWHVREYMREFGRLWNFYQKYMLWFSTRVICVSNAVAEQFDRFKQGEQIHVLHNGFPKEEFLNITPERVNDFRTKYAPSGASCLVGVVGRIKLQRKGQEVFARAAGLLKDNYPNVRFLCIGSPYPGNESHLSELLKLIQELNMEGYVIYTGEIEDIKAAIKGLDILVLSSAQPEPFGGVVIEAMALARPVVATNAGGSREQIVNGQTGYLVEPGNPEAMARSIRKLLESADLRQKFGERGYTRFLEEFEFEKFYQSILVHYEQALNQTHLPA